MRTNLATRVPLLAGIATLVVLGACANDRETEPGLENAGLASQTQAIRAERESKVSTRLTVRWARGGPLTIVDKVELPGLLKAEKTTRRRYICEAMLGAKVVAVQGLDLSFEQRTAGVDIAHPGPQPVDEEVFTVDLPGIALADAEQVTLHLHEVVAQHSERALSIESVARLKDGGRLKHVGDVAVATSRPLGRRVGKKLSVQPDDVP